MDLVLALLLGGLAGLMAGLALPRAEPRPLEDALAGVVGGMLGLRLADALGLTSAGSLVRFLPPVLLAALFVAGARRVRAARAKRGGPPA